MHIRTYRYISSFLIITVLISTGCTKRILHSKSGTTTTVILIRHADRFLSDNRSPFGRHQMPELFFFQKRGTHLAP